MQTYLFQTKLTAAVADAGSYSVRFPDAYKNMRVYSGASLAVDGSNVSESSFRVKFGPSGIDVFNFTGASWASGTIAELSLRFMDQDDPRFSLALSSKRPRTALILGDSITAQAEVILSATSITPQGDGSARVVRTSHSLDVGQQVRLGAAPVVSANLFDAVVKARIDANTVDVAGIGRTHAVTSNSSPSIYMPYRRSIKGWLNWLEFLSGEQFDPTWCAVGGATIRQIDALMETSASYQHDIAFVMLGMNDIYSEGRTLAKMQRDMSRLLYKVQTRATNVCVFSVTCRNSADSAWSAGKQTIHTGFNQWLFEFCRDQGYRYVNSWRAKQDTTTYVNSSATDPDMNSAIAFDNTHPSAVGAYALGSAAYAAYPSSFWNTIPTAAHDDQLGADSGNLLTDSAFATNTGGVATGWATASSTANMNVATTCIPRTVSVDGDAFGYKQRYIISYGTATGTASTQFKKSSMHALMTPGRKVRFSVKVSADSAATGLLGIETTIFGTTANGFWLVYGMSLDSSTDPLTGAISGTIFTPPAIVPPDLSDCFLYVRPYISSAQSSSLTIDIWQPRLEYVD